MKLSLAYHDTVNFPKDRNYESIDLLSSGVTNVTLDNYPNLLRIRISKCPKLQTVTLSNMPKLQAIELLDNWKLQSAIFTKCPSLITIDAGFNSSLTTLKGISNVQYLAIPFSSRLKLNTDDLKSIVYLDASFTKNLNVHKLFQNAPNLECLIFCANQTLNMSDITKCHSLRVLQISSATLNCDRIDSNSNLKIVIFDGCQDYERCITGDKRLLAGLYVTDTERSNKEGKEVSSLLDIAPKYQMLQRLLYGPWGVPDVDKREAVDVGKVIITPPNGVDKEKAADAVAGSIFASAVFDMIGVGVEFINGCVAKPLLLGEPNITWSHPRCNRHNMRFVRGTPTDDTSQNILIMRTIVESNKKDETKGILSSSDCEAQDEESGSTDSSSRAFTFNGVRIDPCLFGEKLIEWIHTGHSEHKHHGGLGCGSTTFAVVNHEKYKTDPIYAAKYVWERSGKKVAPNGSVMRIASSGCFGFWDDELVAKQAEKYARVTHADPRCVYSSVAAALLIAQYVRWNAGLIGEEQPNIDETLQFAKRFVDGIDEYESDVNFYSKCKTVEELKLSENGKIGYCLKAFGSAVWALRYCSSIEEGIKKVIREGGDSDTNGAVVGAVLGAKFGMKGIPKEYVELMFVGQWIFREMKPFMELMGLEMPPSPYI